MRHLTTTFIAAFLCIASQAQETRSSIHFASGSAELAPPGISELDALCGRIGTRVPASVIISGHTDDVGTKDYNRDLSHRRAAAVRAWFAATCPALSDARIEWKGESAPLADNGKEPGRAENRRVEIILSFPTGSAMLAGPPSAPSPCPDQDLLYAHPKVEQLFPVADKRREMHRADAARPVDFTASDGTRVRIAANALVDGNGDPVSGPVDISYRSFVEPYEIIASGIPMHVRTPEGTEHMETAGMYEIYAAQDGRPVHLKAGERINLDRPQGGTPDEDFTGWKLDEATGTWSAGGEIVRPASFVISSTQPINTAATKATNTYWNEMRRLQNEKRPDTTLFDARRASGDYCHLTPCDTTTPGKVGWMQRRDRYTDVAGVPSITVVGYKGLYEPDNILFTVGIDGDGQFPEWRRLPYDAAWGYIGPHSRQMFKRLYGKRHAYQDIDLVMDEDHEEGTLRLKENGEWLELRVSAALNRNTPGRRARWESALEGYAKALAKHRRNFDRDITRKHKRYLREHVNEHLQAWRKAVPDMNAEEKAIASADWKEYALPRKPRPVSWEGLDPKVEAALSQVRTTFNLDDFGIYNIDRILHMCNKQEVIASTTDTDGKPFPWVIAYAVLKNEPSVITYWGLGRGEADNMLVSPGKMASLFLVDGDGNVATAPTGPLNTGDGRAALRVSRLDKNAGIEEVRATAAR